MSVSPLPGSEQSHTLQIGASPLGAAGPAAEVQVLLGLLSPALGQAAAARAAVHGAVPPALPLSETRASILLVRLVQGMGRAMNTVGLHAFCALKQLVGLDVQRLVLQAWLSYLLQSDTSSCCQSWALDPSCLVRPLKPSKVEVLPV